MAVIKRTGSLNAVQIVLSEDLPAGSILQCPWSLLTTLSTPGDFVVLSLLPIPTSPNRFPKSLVYGSDSVKKLASKGFSDAFSSEGKKALSASKSYDVRKVKFDG